jgi:Asp-tRNA(Asn)/Glu-tRNA(Gln) amidotransferase A subunit family amidase
VKDILDLAGTPTRAGSAILGERAAQTDSWAVARLKAAGAVIVGKTRMSEFAYSPGSNNDHYGSVRNPCARDRDSGGSSSGSAAAVAAGIVPAALGTDSGGSIRIPASFCGIVGLKPTFGRLSLAGAVSLSWSCDHLGPLARDVRDAAIVLDALAGRDPRDPRTRKTADGPFASALEGRTSRPLAGLRVGALGADGSGHSLGTDEALAAWKAGLEALEDAGAELLEIDMPELRAARALNSAIIAMESVAFHAPLMRERHADYGDFTRLRMLAGFAYSPEDFVRAQQARTRVRRNCMAVFDRVDLVSTPTMSREAPSLGTPASLTFSSPFNLLGWPAITIPAGRTAAGLPLGLQLAARPWDEATLLSAAVAAEERIGFA